MNHPETLKVRLSKNRAMTSITLRIPVDVVESMKAIAPKRGFAGYQTLLKSYLSECLRRDEAAFRHHQPSLDEIFKVLSQKGVSQDVLNQAAKELA
jgi:hypothetical protein